MAARHACSIPTKCVLESRSPIHRQFLAGSEVEAEAHADVGRGTLFVSTEGQRQSDVNLCRSAVRHPTFIEVTNDVSQSQRRRSITLWTIPSGSAPHALHQTISSVTSTRRLADSQL